LRPRARAAEEIPLNREQVLRLSSRITKVEGLWDLPFIGGDERHVRRLWESAVSGTPISRDEPEQIWLRDGDTWCQLTRGPVLERGSWRDTTGQAVPFPRGYLVLRGAEWAALRERLTSGAGQNTRALGTRERNTLYRIIYALLLSGKYDLAHLSKTAQSLSAQTALGDQPVDAQTIVKHLRAVMELARSESPARTK
jgi:phage-related protein